MGGRKLTVAAAIVGVLITGGGAAYALVPSEAERVAAQEAPDGTQPLTDEEAAAYASEIPDPGPVPSTSAESRSAEASPSAQPSPSSSASSPAPKPSKTSAAGCQTGEYQREVEKYLSQIGTYDAVVVDGRQSTGDCSAIKKFQKRFGISPVNGRAGPTTRSVAKRIATSLTAAEQAKCGAPGSGATVCVNLTLQTVWVVKDGAVVFGPTVTRTGMKGYATPVGTYSVFRRNMKEWSNPYKVWLPYWQNFVRGIGFHATTTYLHNASIGSHGCVNLLYGDAKTLYSTIGIGTRVKVFGHRPGT
ncbi:MAG: murein L,D-transpeptidase [Micromonosporaceae bacterium]|nr:murein L,D-transpeptidase [Micromonosporaceae bacterium]